MEEEVTVSREMLKAIGAETRIGILKALKERQKTQTELADELKLSTPTILEHISQLEKAGLVELVESDKERKWKYYKLTKTGGKLVDRKRINVVILLGSSLLVALGALYSIISTAKSSTQIAVQKEVFEKIVPVASETTQIVSEAPNLVEASQGVSETPVTSEIPKVVPEAAKNFFESSKEIADTVFNETAKNITNITDSKNITNITEIKDIAVTGAYNNITQIENLTKITKTINVINTLIPITEIIILVFAVLIAGVCLGYLIKNR
ncbi:winged helix-turn-helix transcriptional regulator [Candidatus Micrarchaeota archaeon]|nr:winged helix-turn-helix transcriptional regulator [Candidatus Micrarchaeota archaeon]